MTNKRKYTYIGYTTTTTARRRYGKNEEGGERESEYTEWWKTTIV